MQANLCDGKEKNVGAVSWRLIHVATAHAMISKKNTIQYLKEDTENH